MKEFYIGPVQLETKKDCFDNFIKDFYMTFYKKERLKHLARKDKRLPNIKVTDDIFSNAIFFKDKTNRELRLFLDGKIFLSDMKIDSITIEGEEFNKNEYLSIVETLKAISLHSDGYILFANDSKVGRIKNGILDDTKTLMKELYETSPENRTNEQKDLFDWILEFSEDENKDKKEW